MGFDTYDIKISHAIRAFENSRDTQAAKNELHSIVGTDTFTQSLSIFQIFDFSLSEFGSMQFFKELCGLLKALKEGGNISKEAVSFALELTVDRLDDIQLESPHAPEFFQFISRDLKSNL